ncbi:hypothetical protein EDB87DRAFT_1577238 [Lactarius vividus]|nr:hypothetical protein EDB87DRAFT_1577238 [Lactarius vividus]
MISHSSLSHSYQTVTVTEKNADAQLENRAKGVEEPAVQVDLPLVLLLEAEDLHGDDSLLCTFNLVRLDIGTRASISSIYNLWKGFDINLNTDARGEGPSQKYFLDETLILWYNLKLVYKRGGSWVLHYVKSTYAVIDTPDELGLRAQIVRRILVMRPRVQIPELVSQRRRLLKGQLLAVIYGTVAFNPMYWSSRSPTHKLFLSAVNSKGPTKGIRWRLSWLRYSLFTWRCVLGLGRPGFSANFLAVKVEQQVAMATNRGEGATTDPSAFRGHSWI